mmetsp:Transcript_102302/g.161615  ORF Transcript_102302/g.161615 Transcript_102302/m.161615 type:complete len:303 (-) Transcript_102302:4-912(-)
MQRSSRVSRSNIMATDGRLIHPPLHLSPTGVSLVSGAVAGFAVDAALFPLDALKTRVQSRRGLARSSNSTLKGLYRGVGTALVGSVPSSAIFFMVYEASRKRLNEIDCYGSPLVASVFGEIAACGVRVPMDMIKQKLQMGDANSFRSALSGLVRAEAVPLFVASFRATAMRDVLHTSLQMSLYENLKWVAARRTSCPSVDQLPAGQAALCGSLAGAISAGLTTPIDVVRTRVNLRPPPTNVHSIVHYNWKVLCAEECRETYCSKGISGFFAGAGLRAVSMGAGGFLFLGTFELAKGYLNNNA